MPAPESFEYAVVRVVPRVERGEYINAGVILFCRPRRFLGARVALDRRRLAALAPELEPETVAAIDDQLDLVSRICAGDPAAGPIARLSLPERWHWLVSPASTVVQPSPIHTGISTDPAAELDHLFATMVAIPAGPASPGRSGP